MGLVHISGIERIVLNGHDSEARRRAHRDAPTQSHSEHMGNQSLGRSGDFPTTIHLREERLSSEHPPDPFHQSETCFCHHFTGEESILLSIYDRPRSVWDLGAQWEIRQGFCAWVFPVWVGEETVEYAEVQSAWRRVTEPGAGESKFSWRKILAGVWGTHNLGQCDASWI